MKGFGPDSFPNTKQGIERMREYMEFMQDLGYSNREKQLHAYSVIEGRI